MKNTILLFALPILALFSCDSTKQATTETLNSTAKVANKVIPIDKVIYKTGPCMGKCPVFTMTIDQDGYATFNGRKYAKNQGEHTQKLGMSAMGELQTLVNNTGWWNLEDKYDSGILDAPTTYITVVSGGEEKKISFRGAMPDTVKELRDMLDIIVKNDAWSPVEIKPDMTQSWSYEQGPCFGKCPVFSLDIKNDGSATYVGKRFSNKEGIHNKVVAQATLDQLTKLFKEANWFEMENSYDSGISDISQITMTHRNGDMIKKIRFRGESPGNTKSIIDLFKKIANSDDWAKVKESKSNLSSGTIGNELIIKLKERQDISKFVQSYIKQDMKLKKTIAPTMNLYLVSFDANVATPQEMLEWVKAREEVETAEFNKEVGIRD